MKTMITENTDNTFTVIRSTAYATCELTFYSRDEFTDYLTEIGISEKISEFKK